MLPSAYGRCPGFLGILGGNGDLGEEANPFVVVGLDDKHEAFDCLFPQLLVESTYFSQLDYVECLVELVVLQVDLY